MAAGEPAVDEPIVREEEAVAKGCVVGFVRLSRTWSAPSPVRLAALPSMHQRTGSVGDFGAGVDVGVGVEAVVRKLHRHVRQRALQLASGRLAEVLRAWRGDVGEPQEIHGFEPAEPGKHEPVGLVSGGVAQPLHVRN
jgi:hypothetical protein